MHAHGFIRTHANARILGQHNMYMAHFDLYRQEARMTDLSQKGSRNNTFSCLLTAILWVIQRNKIR